MAAVSLSIYSNVSERAIKLKCHRNARQGALQIDVKSGARSRCGSEFCPTDGQRNKEERQDVIFGTLQFRV